MKIVRRRAARYAPVVIAILACLMISACGQSGSKAKVDNLSASPAPRALKIAQATLLTAKQARGLTSLPWRLTAIHVTPPAIDIYYVAGGGCTTPRGILLTETSTSVTIEAVGATRHGAQACPANLITGYVRIPLSQPLAGRHLIHAPVARSWSSSDYLR